MYESLTNWGRWGARRPAGHAQPPDRPTPGGRRRPGAPGESVSLAHDLATEPMPEHPHPVQHHMLASGDALDVQRHPGLRGGPRPPGPRHPRPVDHPRRRPVPHVRAGPDVRGAPGLARCAVTAPGRTPSCPWPTGWSAVGSSWMFPGPWVSTSSTPEEVVTVDDLEATETAQGVRVGTGDILVGGRPRGRRAATAGLRRVLRPARRVPALAGRAPGGGAGQRRDLRPHTLRRHSRVALPGAPDRHRGDGPAPHRQPASRGRWPLCADPGVGSSSSPWPPCASPRGRAARSIRWPCCEPDPPGHGSDHEEIRALLQRYSRAVDERDVDAWPACSIPRPASSGRGATRTWRSGWTPCGRPGRSR